LPLPVYALGGLNESDLEAAWDAGAIGVAGISAFW
ncbi:MAG: thiamine phosphate synthase, partial [Gammaproteobacteria bacterium]